MSLSSSSDDDDPVVATFNVFVNPTLPAHQKVHILHQSVRYDEGNTPAFPRVPSELRVKPDSGVLEVEVPLDMMDNYDRDKGMHYGRALKDTTESKGGGSHGLAGGFGIGAPPTAGRKAGERERDRERRYGEWVDEVRSDRVLKSQTLGGIIPKTEPLTYMIGIFQGHDLHLTPANSFVNLSPQLHHVDAVSQLEKAAPSGAAKDAPAAPAPAAATRAIHMTIKTAGDGEAVVTETMADRLRAVQAEPWRRMRFVDENDEEAWDVFTNTFVPKREVKEPAEGEEEGEAKSLDADLETVGWLETDWVVGDIERMLSGKGPAEAEEQQQVKSEEGAADGRPRVKFEEDAGRMRGRMPPPRPTGSSARRGRAGDAMQID